MGHAGDGIQPPDGSGHLEGIRVTGQRWTGHMETYVWSYALGKQETGWDIERLPSWKEYTVVLGKAPLLYILLSELAACVWTQRLPTSSLG
jgi:hypothetical protein